MSTSPLFPARLRDIPSPPKNLYIASINWENLLSRPKIAVVGSRRMSSYGKQVTYELASRLAEQGVVIVSGLAYGVDAEAHRAALAANGHTIAVLPSPLDNVVPVANRRLAQQIIDQGGAVISEYAPGTPPLRQNFVIRNRIVSGLAEAVLVTEATTDSGSKHTVNYALDQGREVMVVPGDITRPTSAGTNQLLQAGKAAAVAHYTDILRMMRLVDHSTPVGAVKGSTAQEQALLDLMLNGISDGEDLLTQSVLSVSEFNQTLTMLEISGKIRPLGANHWAIR